MSIVHGANGPAHDKPREQVEDRREIELAAGPDDKLRRVTDLALIRARCLERLPQEIVRNRLIVIADRRVLVPLPRAGPQLFLLHQPHDSVAAHADVLLDQIFMHARAAVVAATPVEGRAHQAQK